MTWFRFLLPRFTPRLETKPAVVLRYVLLLLLLSVVRQWPEVVLLTVMIMLGPLLVVRLLKNVLTRLYITVLSLVEMPLVLRTLRVTPRFLY